MKKLLAIFFLFIGITTFAQTLPNNDMELWDNFFGYEQPENWNTPNPYTVFFGSVGVTKSEDSFNGNYSAKLITTEILQGQLTVPGVLTLADFSLDFLDSSFSISGGYFLQENIHKLSGYYKYSGVDGDSASLFMYNFKNNPDTGFDTIGAGYLTLRDATEWQPFTIFMQNFNSSVPDTFNVIISSSSLLSAKVGSVLLIDKLTLHTNTGIIDLWNPKNPLKVFPNPAIDIINFQANNIETGSVLTIYNNFGQKIIEKKFDDLLIEINTSALIPGVYVYKLIKENKILNSGSFIKQN